MQIERLSDLQIKCTLTNSDLLARDINILELAYGHEKARNLFNEMLQRASHELGFNAGSLPLMVEAIPLPDEGIIIIITKVEDPEEVDTLGINRAREEGETKELLPSLQLRALPPAVELTISHLSSIGDLRNEVYGRGVLEGEG